VFLCTFVLPLSLMALNPALEEEEVTWCAQDIDDDSEEPLKSDAFKNNDDVSEDRQVEDAYMTSMHMLEMQEAAITQRMNHFLRLQLREVESFRRYMERHLTQQRQHMQKLATFALNPTYVDGSDAEKSCTKTSTLESCLLESIDVETEEDMAKQKEVFMLGAFVTDVVPLSDGSPTREVDELAEQRSRRRHSTMQERLSVTLDSGSELNDEISSKSRSPDASRMGSLQTLADVDSDTSHFQWFANAKAIIHDRSKKRESDHKDKSDLRRAASLRKDYENAKKMMRSGSRFGQGVDDMLEWWQTETKHFQSRFTTGRVLPLGHLQQFVENPKFKICIISLIFLNALFVGVTSDISVRSVIESYDSDSGASTYTDTAKSGWWLAVDTGFNCVFFIELVTRILAFEGRFCVGRDWQWNIFDAAVVSLSIFEMTLLSMGLNLNIFRVLRFARVLPSLRMLRLIRYISLVRKLRFMMMAILSSRTMLMWSVIVLILEMFLFSIIFLNGVVQYIADASSDDEYVDTMKVFFGSLPMTILTLFMSVSGGVDYWDVLRLLLIMSWGYAVLFIVFIILTVLAVMNVINAIFVNDAMETTRMDKDLRMQQEADETRMMLERLQSLFFEMDETERGSISQEDFLNQVQRHDVKYAFSLIGVHFADAATFFKHLNASGNGQLSIDEFVIGCIRIKGGGILIDMDVQLKETKSKMKGWMRQHEEAISLVSARVALLCERFEVAAM